MLNLENDDDDFVPPAAGLTDPIRVAALDLGSNSFHLIVVEVRPDGSVVVLQKARDMVRLGESVFLDGRISVDAFDRGLASLHRLAEVASAHAPETILAVATSAIREAENGRDFVEAAGRLTGLNIRVIDGIEEACIIYHGARRALPAASQRVALFDVGGGSTEAVLGNDRDAVLSSSVKVGVLRLRDNWLVSDPPSPGDLGVVSQWVQTVMTPTIDRFRASGFDLVALTSGTAMQLGRLVGRRLPPVGGIERFKISLDALYELERRLVKMMMTERAALPGLDPGRVDTVVPGLVIVRTILELAGVSHAVICNAALREGLIADYLMHGRAELRAAAPARDEAASSSTTDAVL
jgi:exopolyphosphatase/guanosine-5'-triphosphate,3'-diphosphate pyrophosphatase